MDLDGQWKPPQEWPESTPPLPGWIRNADGMWSNEALQNLPNTETEIREPTVEMNLEVVDLTEPTTAPAVATPSPAATPSVTPDAPRLSYSHDAIASDHIVQDHPALPRRALTAAVTAAIIAVMLGAGIVLLILL